MREILLATGNLHKVREIGDMLRSILGKIEIFSLRSHPDYTSPEETGKTFEENARLKALEAAKALNTTVLADDSGLVVPALQGAPGIFSARYAGPDASDAENRKKLLAEMKDLKDIERSAQFVCAICIAGPDGVIAEQTGIIEGRILEQEQGGGGFGYDPLFVKHDYSKTFAELDEATKNRISHRRKALDRLTPMLAQ